MPSPSRLRVDGRVLRDAENRRVQLRGVNVCSFEFDPHGRNWQLTGQGSALIPKLADPQRWSANVVRIPLNQQWFLDDDAYVARVEQVLDSAAAHGMYAIVEPHWEVGRKLEPYHANILKLPTFGPGNTTERFWRKAMARWRPRTGLLYDLINEPHGVSAAQVRQGLQRMADLIFEQQPEAVVIAGGPNWAHSVDDYRTHPLRGPNVVYSAHQYLPHDPPRAFHRRFGRLAETAPVLIGEFALEDPAYARELIAYAEAKDLSGWLLWAVGCGFGVDDYFIQRSIP